MDSDTTETGIDLIGPTCILSPQPEGYRHRFHAMVKPIGSRCNLGCTYCYYLHKEELLRQPALPQMSEVVLEQHIRQYIEAQTGDEVVFSWQGGEPTLLGWSSFRRLSNYRPTIKSRPSVLKMISRPMARSSMKNGRFSSNGIISLSA